MKKPNGVLTYVLVLLVLIFGASLLFDMVKPVEKKLDYSTIVGYFQNDQVQKFTLDMNNGELVYKLRKTGSKDEKYKVPNVSVFFETINKMVFDRNNPINKSNTENKNPPVIYNYKELKNNSWLMNFLPTLLIVGVMIGFWIFVMRQQTGGKIGSFGKSTARTQPLTGKKTTFEDVAGANEEKEELAEIVDYLKMPAKYNNIGARIPKGILLMGPPGTGKTLLAKAVAGEAGVPFYSISGSDFVEMFVGVGASRVRDLFEQAKKTSPSIVFIDEIDAVGRHRGAGLGGGHDEREQTLNQLLVEMDGFGNNEGIIVIAATNRRDILDPALLRPGRFDRQILVNYPDIKGREEILIVHSRNKKLAEDVSLNATAKATVGFTGADLENLMNEAALFAVKHDRTEINKQDIEEATIKVMMGPEKKSRIVTEKSKILTAYHEAGHAICSYFCENEDKVHQISIIPRGMAGGYTMYRPEEDKDFVTKGELFESLISFLGGRVAEEIKLEDISTGASNDLERATKIARNMITRYGFSKKLGTVVYGQADHEVFLGREYSQGANYSEKIASQIDEEISALILQAYEQAKDILTKNDEKLELVSKTLLEKEKLDAEEFVELMER